MYIKYLVTAAVLIQYLNVKI